MKKKLEKNQVQEWVDGELEREAFDSLSDESLLKMIRKERLVRIMIGHAFFIDDPSMALPVMPHIDHNDMGSFLDECFSSERTSEISRHLMCCKSCFSEYIELYLLTMDDVEPLPDGLRDRLLTMVPGAS